jgi:tetratricopeptide (TPR) repeat protein
MEPMQVSSWSRVVWRRGVELVCLICLGCQTLPNSLGMATSSGGQLWAQGEAALRSGESAQAVQLFERSLDREPELRKNHLSLAAAYLAEGKEDRTCDHLEKFLAAQPDHRNARYLYAELLFKRGLRDQARVQFEETIAVSQEDRTVDARHMVHCHGRLMALAEEAQDDYQVQLQRGLGLYWLAQARRQLGDPDGEMPVEALLCRAAACLSAAHGLQPDAARPTLYLHAIWRRLGQHQQAQRWLTEAAAAAAFSPLTPQEQRQLHLAQAGTDSHQR